MKFEVHTLPRAELDAAEIFSYISGRSADGALRWLNALEQAIELLAQGNPEACSLDAEDDISERTIRQFFFKTRRWRTYRAYSRSLGMRFGFFASEARARRLPTLEIQVHSHG